MSHILCTIEGIKNPEKQKQKTYSHTYTGTLKQLKRTDKHNQSPRVHQIKKNDDFWLSIVIPCIFLWKTFLQVID